MIAVQAARRCPPEQLADLFEDASWPAFIGADAKAATQLPRVREEFSTYELALVEEERVVAAGWGVPIVWGGDPSDLTSGYSDSLVRALDDLDAGRIVDTFVLCAVQVRADATARAVATAMITALTNEARSRGLVRVIAPLRPTLKHRYPLTPIDQFAGWVRTDGRPLDPWLRTHVRLGARVLATTENSQTFTGTIAQWQEWSGLALPASGTYVVPDALAPLTVDVAADRGICVEPGIWVQHR